MALQAANRRESVAGEKAISLYLADRFSTYPSYALII